MLDVTIIIPVYVAHEDQLPWLEECLQSAVSQGCQVTAYDDGSPVNTLDVLSRYIQKFSYRKENLGVSTARNEAVKLAETSLILPLDCDDQLVPGAVAKLVSAWEGVPVYPDICKFGDEDWTHYQLLDWDCDHLLTHVGFTSVNVLHAKDQWAHVGGWNPAIEFYEDGEYNARLLGTFCGIRYPEPLIRYRMHSGQRTKKYQKQSSEYAKQLIEKIRRYDMPCASCGGRSRRSFTSSAAATKEVIGRSAATTEVMVGDSYKSLPNEVDGKVLARYVGGEGKAKHYYQGQGSKTAYKVKFGDVTYVDPRDARDESANSDTRLFVRIVNAPKPVPPPAAVVKPPEPERVVHKEEILPPPVRVNVVQKVFDLPDITNMTYADVTDFDWSGVNVPAVIRMEANGKARKNVLNYLKNKVSSVPTD